MSESDKTSKSEDPSYLIDLDWFQENDRCFAAIACHCLCSACQERLASELMEVEVGSLVVGIKDCCSKAPGFVNSKLSLLEKIFRIFLSNGNEPLTPAELISQLAIYSETPVLVSTQTIKCLLDNDKYYGFSQRPWRR